MLAIMITDKPRYACEIMNIDKTIAVRKNKALAKAIKKLIDKYGKARIYVIVSKSKPYLIPSVVPEYKVITTLDKEWLKDRRFNGKVAFMFECKKVEDIKYHNYDNIYETDNLTDKELLAKSCLSWFELNDYLKGEKGYVIHISNLTIFNRPKELNEFITPQELEHYNRDLEFARQKDYELFERYGGEYPDGVCANAEELTELSYELYCIHKAPQNYCYIESEE